MRRGKRGRYNQGNNNQDRYNQKNDYYQGNNTQNNQSYSTQNHQESGTQKNYPQQDDYNNSQNIPYDNYIEPQDSYGNNFSRQSGNPFGNNSYNNNKYKKREYNKKQEILSQQNEGEQINQQQQYKGNKPSKEFKYPPNRLYANYKFDFNENFEKIQNQKYAQNNPISQNNTLPIKTNTIPSNTLIKEEKKEINETEEKLLEDYDSDDENDKEELKKAMDRAEINESQLLNSITNKKEILFSENHDRNIIYKIVEKNLKLVSNIEILANILETLQSPKNDAEIQEDLVDLMGYDDIETISEFITNRKEVNELAQAAKIVIEGNSKVKRNMDSQFGINNNPSSAVNLEVISAKNKNKKKFDKVDFNKTQTTNLQILKQLGFDKIMLRENQLLGLHEKPISSTVTKKYGGSTSSSVGTNPSHFLTNVKKDKTKVETIVKPILLDKKPVPKVLVQSLPEWAQRAFNFKEFNDIQSTVFNTTFKSDSNILICAPTGAGKTNIALLAILREINKSISNNQDFLSGSRIDFSKIKWNFKIVYLAPLKALANEIVEKFKTSLSFLNLKISEFSGDVGLSKDQIEETQLFIAIPEKWDLFTRKNETIFQTLKLMIIDEVHLLNEDRGRVLECLVARTIRKCEINQLFIRTVGLSATLPNYWDVARFLQVTDGCFYFDSNFRATPLKMKFLGVIERSNIDYMDCEGEVVFQEIVKYLEKWKQVLVFVHSRADTVNFAKEIIRRAQNNDRIDLLSPDNSKIKIPKFSNHNLNDLVPYGVGFHNAGLMRRDRNSVESLFANKYISVLVSTSTLAWGVNLPAYAVIIKGVQFYDASKGQLTDMSILDIQQMFGRAGRPQFDKKGVGVIACNNTKINHFISLLKNQIEIESKLPKYLEDSINAEIAINNIHTLDDAVNWLNLTYLAIRISRNPSIYNFIVKDIRHLNLQEALREIAKETFEKLHKYKLIRYVSVSESVNSTELGRIATKYYMSYQSVSKFYEKLKPLMLHEEFLNLLGESQEFANMKEYSDEKRELDLFKTKVCFVKTNSKAIILLQAYLNGVNEFSVSSLHQDCAYIADNCPRILRGVLEICIHKRLIDTTLLALTYVKCLEKRVSPGSHPIYQFTYESYRAMNSLIGTHNKYQGGKNDDGFISQDKARHVNDSKIPLDEIFREDKLVLSKILKCNKDWVDEARGILSSFPRFKVKLDIKPITRTILNITINLTPTFKWKNKWNHLSEPFWVIVDNKTEIIHHEFFILTNKKNEKELSISFAVPFKIEAGSREADLNEYYTISVISDRWLGSEFSETIELNSIKVPMDQDVSTELLDLNPLPIKALNNPEFEKIFEHYKYFNPVQTQVFFSCFNSDVNILVGAPTGSGKTVVAELGILRVFKNKPLSKVIYIAPLKSLAKERIRDWTKKFSGMQKKVLELTGDFTPEVKQLLDADILITTPEKWDCISRNWHHRSYVQRVALVVIDEIHLLGLERGPILEVIVSRMRFIAEKTKSDIRFIGLSTALANSFDVATWLGIPTNFESNKPPGLFNFKPAIRPCPVTVHIEGFPEKHYCPRMGTMNKPAFNAIKEFSPSKPVLVFVSSRRQTRLTALDLISFCAHNTDLKRQSNFLKINIEEMRNIIETVKDENLKHTLLFGIGMHHAGLVESDRKVVEDLFYNLSIQVLIATSTLAWGVNFPAHLVIIKGTEYFDPKVKTYVDMPITDVLQMIGRAGRPQYDDSAVACLFVSQEKKNFYKKFLYEPFPLESTLHKMLFDHLNAEISTGSLNSKQACIDYMTWTYFFRRLLKNPTYYGLKNVNANELNKFLSNLIDDCLKQLSISKCITLADDGQISSTLLGYLCSFYYLSFKTAMYFENTLKAGLNIISLIEILSDATEFAQVPVRHNEEDLNETLAKICPYEVNHLHLDSPHVKTNLLLQAYFSKLPLPISDYLTDLRTVMDNSVRILLFMVDLIAEKGILDTCINIILLLQMVIQGIWIYDSSLLTIPHLTNSDILKIKDIYKIEYLPELMNQKDKLQDIIAKCNLKLSFNEKNKIKQVLDKLPDIKVSYKVYSLDQNTLERKEDLTLKENADAQLSIRLEKVNSQHDNLVISNTNNKIKTCRWFIIIGDESKNELLAIKKISFRYVTRKDINFVIPKDYMSSKLFLYIFSDSYIGLDQQYYIDIDQINKWIIKKYNLIEKKIDQEDKNISLKSITDEFSNREYLPFIENTDKKEIEVKEEELSSDASYDDELIFDNW